MQIKHQKIEFHAKGFFIVNYKTMLQVRMTLFNLILTHFKEFVFSQFLNGIMTYCIFFIQFAPRYKVCHIVSECQENWERNNL